MWLMATNRMYTLIFTLISFFYSRITLFVNISGRSEDDDSPIEFWLASSQGTALPVNTTVFPYVFENGLYKINMHIPRWSPYGYYYASLSVIINLFFILI